MTIHQIHQIHQDREPQPPTRWMDRAACQDADPGLFFPISWSDQDSRREEQARRICHTCPVQEACFDWAMLTGEPDGMWGGTTPAERRQLRARKRLVTA